MQSVNITNGRALPADVDPKSAGGSWVIRGHNSIETGSKDLAGKMLHAGGLSEATAVASQKRRFELLLEQSFERAFMTSEDGRVTFISSSLRKFFGRRNGEFAIWDVVHPSDVGRVKSTFSKITAVDGQRELFTLRAADHNGQWRHVEIIGINLLSDPDVGSIVFTLRDVQSMVELVSERDLLRAKLQQVTCDSETFLLSLSHELRTPLTVIYGYAQMLMEDTFSIAELRRSAAAIYKSAKAELRLIDDLLEAVDAVTGNVRLDIVLVDPARLLQEVVDSVRFSAGAKDLNLKVQAVVGMRMLAADERRLRHAFWHLLTNAVRFTPAGGTVDASVVWRPDQVVITVADTGQGIDPHFLPYVFDRFSQEDSSRTRRHGGLGHGLAIVRQITELHGGHVGAASLGPGKGAVFTITLPVREATSSH